jgi:hypothetical protein
MHMTLARQLAGELGHGLLHADAGAYLLGAAAPDIRVLTKGPREDTHFFKLDNFDEQSGVAGLFESYPDLREAGRLDSQTAAFLCGYISHLDMDETWIAEIYRPCFGERSPLKGEALANVLDRVLQFELDRREREDGPTVERMRADLLAMALDVVVGFIDGEALGRWRDISADILTYPPTWDRFGMIASRHLKSYGVESEADVAHFMRNVPDLLDQAICHVTQERLDAFLERSRERARTSISEYLS